MLVARETYQQSQGNRQRTLDSEAVFVRLPPPWRWALFRDVFEVDGRKVRDRDSRLEQLFLTEPASARTRADEILAESARYNLGVRRIFNFPTVALVFLHAENQSRLRFRLGDTKEVARRRAQSLRFEEQARPTLIGDGSGGDVPVRGEFWIDVELRTVLRSEMDSEFDVVSPQGRSVGRGRALIIVHYQPLSGSAMWVPVRMEETYKPGRFTRWPTKTREPEPGPIRGIATYTDYRQFAVETNTKVESPR